MFQLRAVQGDILKTDADVIALKYAQAFYGADRAVVNAMYQKGLSVEGTTPRVNAHALLAANGAVASRQVLLVGVPPLALFSYPEIRRFAADVLRILAKEAPRTRHLAMTMHGAGFGLDEKLSALQQFDGYLDAVEEGNYPRSLHTISIVDRDAERHRVIADLIASRQAAAQRGFSPAPAAVQPKKIFVAMPFAKEMRTVWRFGIQQPVNSLNLLCERVDQEAFVGDIMDQVKSRIESAALVIADLTGTNANVFLEVGYAWGREVPTLFLCQKTEDKKPLRFDLRGHKCIFYEDAVDLSEQIESFLRGLKI